MKVSLKPKEARIEHPTVPGLAVYLRSLTPEQRVSLGYRQSKALGQLLGSLAGAGAPAGAGAVDMDGIIASVRATLRNAIVKIDGLQNEDGTPIVSAPGNLDDIIQLLWDDDFTVADIEQTVWSEEKKEFEKKVAPMKFPTYLMRKLSDKATFGPPADIDPKGSQPQSN